MKVKVWAGLLTCVCLALVFKYGRAYWYPVYSKVVGKQTVNSVIEQYGDSAMAKLKPAFAEAGLEFPPQKIALLAVKQDKVVELWGKNDGDWQQVKTYNVLAASGVLGPKLREGDRQVPEGIYQISGLNPNSSYHLSMKLNYPNPYDLKWATAEGRTQPGTNIFIHGKNRSIGCLAMGDSAIEELFVLVNEVGRSNVKVIISPTDPRNASLVAPEGSKAWVVALYSQITQAFVNVTQQR